MSCLLILFCVIQLCSRYQRSRRRPLSPNQDQGLAGNSNVQIIGDQSPPNYVTVVLDEDSLPTYEEAEKRSKELHRPENLKKSRQKLVKSNFFFVKLHFKLFPSLKIDFWPFLKLQKMKFGQKNFFREIDLFDLTSFLGLDFFKFSGPMCVC